MENGFSITYVDKQDSLIADLRRMLTAAIARAETAESALAERDKPCVWTEMDNGNWHSGCDEEFFYRGKFCPDCGHPVEVVP